MLSKSLVVNCALLKIHNEGPCLCKSCSAQARDLFGNHGSRFSGFAAIYPCLEWAMIAWAQNSKLGQIWTALDSTLRMIRDYQAIKRLAMASRIILVSPLRLQLAMLSPVPHEMHLSNNQTANLLCSAIILEGLLRFLSLLGSTTVLPVLTRMCAKMDACQKSNRFVFFAGRKQNLLGTTALKTAWMLDIFATWIYSNSP